MQPFNFNRRYYERTLFSCIEAVDMTLRNIGLQINVRDLCRALKSVETNLLEESAAVASGLAQKVRDPRFKHELLASVKAHETAGRAPHFVLVGKDGKKHFIQLGRIIPGAVAIRPNRLERL